MNLFFLNSLFKKKHQLLKLPESFLVKKLKTVIYDNALNIFENITIYHHTENFFLPLLVLDQNRGIFLFEYKDWSYNDLKNAKAQKASDQEPSKETLAFDRSHSFIKRKFNEITHSDGVPIFNYLLMENLNSDEYEHLDISFKELLPKEKIMFSDSSQDEILNKLTKTEISKDKLPDVSNVMGTLLIQYAILNNTNSLHLASKEQMDFIDMPLVPYYTLKAPSGSGKTSCALLKAILEKLKNPEIKIIIIKPTILSCDILKKKLLEYVEHAIIELDLTSIEVITPIELANRHLIKLHKPHIEHELYLDKALMKKSFDAADLIMCDDSQMYPAEFIEYLKHIQKNASLIMIENSNLKDENLSFSKNFKNQNKTLYYKKANQLAKAIHIISSLLKSNEAKDILVVGSSLSQEKLKDDLKFFIKDKAFLLDSSKNLIEQDIDNLLLSSYEDTNSIDVNYVILMDICFADAKLLEYACNIARKSLYILYEDECENLNLIRNNFENTKK